MTRKTWLPLEKECIKKAVYLKQTVNISMESIKPYVIPIEVVDEEDNYQLYTCVTIFTQKSLNLTGAAARYNKGYFLSLIKYNHGLGFSFRIYYSWLYFHSVLASSLYTVSMGPVIDNFCLVNPEKHVGNWSRITKDEMAMVFRLRFYLFGLLGTCSIWLVL
jgi:hypothetical protein